METIILTGMRGTGKSTIGFSISEKIGAIFIDLDKYIEKKVGNINNYIDKNGWDKFRDLENEILIEVLKINGKKVISLGGGTIIFERNILEINKIKDKIIFFLETDLKNIEKRIKNDELNNNKRNSLTGKGILEELEEVYINREKIYKENCDYIIDNNGKIKDSLKEIFKIINSKKICIPIVDFNENYLSKVYNEINNLEEINFIELRIDFLENLEKLNSIIKKFSKKVIVTNRIKDEGGNFSGTIEESIQIAKKSLKEGAYLVDLELQILEKYGNIGEIDNEKLILSYHNFTKTPNLEDLKNILENMAKFNPKIFKIAVKPNIKKDLKIIYELVSYFKQNYIGKDFIFISMGELGMETRINIPKEGGFLTFASYGGDSSAPGQIDYKDLFKKILN